MRKEYELFCLSVLYHYFYIIILINIIILLYNITYILEMKLKNRIYIFFS